MMRSFKYCRLYEDFHHRTVMYFQLQEEIEVLIINNYLNEFVVGMRDDKKSIEKEKKRKNFEGGMLKKESLAVLRSVLMWV